MIKFVTITIVSKITRGTEFNENSFQVVCHTCNYYKMESSVEEVTEILKLQQLI